jgi:hypothetical protein
VFDPARPFQLSLMFAGETRSLPNNGAPSLDKAPNLLTNIRPAKDKHSSLSQTFVNCSCKKFYNNGPSTQSEAKLARNRKWAFKRCLHKRSFLQKPHTIATVAFLSHKATLSFKAIVVVMHSVIKTYCSNVHLCIYH